MMVNFRALWLAAAPGPESRLLFRKNVGSGLGAERGAHFAREGLRFEFSIWSSSGGPQQAVMGCPWKSVGCCSWDWRDLSSRQPRVHAHTAQASEIRKLSG